MGDELLEFGLGGAETFLLTEAIDARRLRLGGSDYNILLELEEEIGSEGLEDGRGVPQGTIISKLEALSSADPKAVMTTLVRVVEAMDRQPLVERLPVLTPGNPLCNSVQSRPRRPGGGTGAPSVDELAETHIPPGFPPILNPPSLWHSVVGAEGFEPPTPCL
jgi:hypothetical protein